MIDGNDKLYDFVKRSAASGFDNSDEPSLTVQADKDDADINTIVARFGLTGRMPEGLRVPSFQDYDGVFDFQTAMHAIIQAEDNFMAMPATVRAKFNNDPGQFLQFAVDPANVDVMVEMGLAIPKPVEPVVDAVVE
ncbi:MAG: internal scaffolding protein [Microvirus sp.]|nr:MAG: internal scaffolding protein [Microvirus sp.]